MWVNLIVVGLNVFHRRYATGVLEGSEFGRPLNSSQQSLVARVHRFLGPWVRLPRLGGRAAVRSAQTRAHLGAIFRQVGGELSLEQVVRSTTELALEVHRDLAPYAVSQSRVRESVGEKKGAKIVGKLRDPPSMDLYRPFIADRIKPNRFPPEFQAERFLNSELSLPYQDPYVLRPTRAEPFEPTVTVKKKASRVEVLKHATDLNRVGRALAIEADECPDTRDSELMATAKNDEFDRNLLDRRQANEEEVTPIGPSRHMPTGDRICDMHLGKTKKVVKNSRDADEF